MDSKGATRYSATPRGTGSLAAVKSDSVKVCGPRGIGPLLRICTPRRRTDRLGLTRVEFQLVVDLLSGHEDAEVARRASLTEDALARHLAVVFENFGVCDRFELALLLAHRGF